MNSADGKDSGNLFNSFRFRWYECFVKILVDVSIAFCISNLIFVFNDNDYYLATSIFNNNSERRLASRCMLEISLIYYLPSSILGISNVYVCMAMSARYSSEGLIYCRSYLTRVTRLHSCPVSRLLFILPLHISPFRAQEMKTNFIHRSRYSENLIEYKF